jgi:hypothetical protein
MTNAVDRSKAARRTDHRGRSFSGVHLTGAYLIEVDMSVATGVTKEELE